MNAQQHIALSRGFANRLKTGLKLQTSTM